MPAKGVCLHAENLSLALLFLIGRHFSSNQKLFLFSRIYKRSQLYILYFDDSLDKFQTKSFGKYETSASDHITSTCSLHRAPKGIQGLLILDDDTRRWLKSTPSTSKPSEEDAQPHDEDVTNIP